jgi:hypothetical protein
MCPDKCIYMVNQIFYIHIYIYIYIYIYTYIYTYIYVDIYIYILIIMTAIYMHVVDPSDPRYLTIFFFLIIIIDVYTYM